MQKRKQELPEGWLFFFFLNANTLKLKLFFFRIAGMPVLERVSRFLYLGQNKTGRHELREGQKVLSLPRAPNFIVSMFPDTLLG